MEQKTAQIDQRDNAWNRVINFAHHPATIAATKSVTSITGTGGIVIPALSIVLSLIIGAEQPGYNPVSQTISQLVYYPQGWLQAVDFLILGIWLMLLSLKCYANFAHKTTTKIAAVLFVALALGFLIIAICPTNIPGRESTMRGLIHDRAAQTICSLFPIICWLMIPEFKVHKPWNKLVHYTLITAIIGLVLGITGATVMVTDAPYLGIIERLIFLNAVIWLAVVGFYIVLQSPHNRDRGTKIARCC